MGYGPPHGGPPPGSYPPVASEFRAPPLPARRPPGTGPYCQVLIKEEGQRPFSVFIEDILRRNGFTAEVLHILPQWSVPQLISTLVSEGVGAIFFLERMHEQRKTVSFQTFDRNGNYKGTC